MTPTTSPSKESRKPTRSTWTVTREPTADGYARVLQTDYEEVMADVGSELQWSQSQF